MRPHQPARKSPATHQIGLNAAADHLCEIVNDFDQSLANEAMWRDPSLESYLQYIASHVDIVSTAVEHHTNDGAGKVRCDSLVKVFETLTDRIGSAGYYFQAFQEGADS